MKINNNKIQRQDTIVNSLLNETGKGKRRYMTPLQKKKMTNEEKPSFLTNMTSFHDCFLIF